MTINIAGMFGIFFNEKSTVYSKLLSNSLEIILTLRKVVQQQFLGEEGKFTTFQYQVSSGCCIPEIIGIDQFFHTAVQIIKK